MNPADLVERLREDANGLRQAVSQASFASDTYVRVKQPDLLIAVLNEAAAEIERLRKALERYANGYCGEDTARAALREKAHEPG